MKLVLLKEVKNLGHAGDIKDVNEGFGLNYLLPQKLAAFVTKYTAGMLAAQKMKKERIRKKLEKEKHKLARKINGQNYAIRVKTDEKGTLYAGLDQLALAKELAGFDIAVTADDIIMDNPIKKTGVYDINLRLAGEDVKIKLKIKGF